MMGRKIRVPVLKTCSFRCRIRLQRLAGAWLFCECFLAAAAPAIAASKLEGSWTNPKRSVTVRIGPCGGAFCGRVTAASPQAREAADKAGTKRLVGTKLITDIRQTGPNGWRAQIFVPDQNIHSSGEISLEGRNHMLVRGCVVGGLICKNQRWTRVAGPVRRSH
jgi:uncharacterized protein (DUF2147 family)